MRRYLIASLIAIHSTAAAAQNCNSVGNALQCDNGTSGYTYGNQPGFGIPPTSKRNETRFCSDQGSSPYSGSTTIFSDGATGYRNGSTIQTDEGRACQTIGVTVVCN